MKSKNIGFSFQDMEVLEGRRVEERGIEECGYEGHVTGMEGCPDEAG